MVFEGHVCYLWFPRVTLHLYNNIQLTMSGLCNHPGHSYGLTLVYVHAPNPPSGSQHTGHSYKLQLDLWGP